MMRERWLILPGVGFLLFFFGYPFLTLLQESLTSSGHLSFVHYMRALSSPLDLEAWRNTILFALGSTLLAVLGGIFIAYWVAQLPLALKRVILSLFAIPVSLSGLVVAFGFIVLLGRNGILNQILADLGLPPLNLFSWAGLISVFPFYNIPLFSLTLAPLIEQKVGELMEAARASGARPLQAWRYVLLPSLLPGILAGASIVFAGMMGAFGTTLALTGLNKNLLSIQIYALVSNFELSKASALGVILVLTTGFGLYLLTRIERRQA